jgi:hypothetical protein
MENEHEDSQVMCQHAVCLCENDRQLRFTDAYHPSTYIKSALDVIPQHRPNR